MGADNQAEKVIARMEWRDELAQILFHTLYTGLEWEHLPDSNKNVYRLAIVAIIERINNKMQVTP